MDNFANTYTLAHTARCKLQIAADHPDRNLRFILGHAFTLDKLRLRLAEIEDSSDEDLLDDPTDTRPTSGGDGAGHSHNHTHSTDSPTPADAPAPVSSSPRRVSFSNQSRPSVVPHRARSPPPTTIEPYGDEDGSDSSSDDGVYDDYDDEELQGGGLGLTRFASAAAEPPRLIADEGDDDEVEINEPKSPTEEELRELCAGEADGSLLQGYKNVAGCPCHGEVGPKVEKVWALPGKGGPGAKRVAVVQIAA